MASQKRALNKELAHATPGRQAVVVIYVSDPECRADSLADDHGGVAVIFYRIRGTNDASLCRPVGQNELRLVGTIAAVMPRLDVVGANWFAAKYHRLQTWYKLGGDEAANRGR